jgi:hypothetical protein
MRITGERVCFYQDTMEPVLVLELTDGNGRKWYATEDGSVLEPCDEGVEVNGRVILRSDDV